MNPVKSIFFALLFVLLSVALVGCISTSSFGDQFQSTKAILERNGAIFPDSVVPPTLQQINAAQFELEGYRLSKKNGIGSDTRALDGFLEAETHLMEMQKNFFLGREQVALTDFAQISCDSGSTLDKAKKNYEIAGLEADLAKQTLKAFQSNFPSEAASTGITFDSLESELDESKAVFGQLRESVSRYCS